MQSTQSLAANRLLKSVQASASDEGGEWLSEPEVYELLGLFSKSNIISGMYANMLENEHHSRGWLWNLLEKMALEKAACASAPGSSEAA